MTTNTSNKTNCCAVIITALRVEYNAVSAHLENISEDEHSEGDVYERGQFSAGENIWDVGIIEIGKGNPNAAQKTERAITHFKPNVVLFVGVAGGIKDVKIGDVVVAEKVYGYHAGKADDEFQTRPEIGLPNHRIFERARAESRKPDWTKCLASTPQQEPYVCLGAIAAGEQVVSSTQSDTYRLIREHYSDALAVEMESYGFLNAAHAHSGLEALVVRGISDLLENKEETDKDGMQELASRHAAAFAFNMLAKLTLPNKAGQIEIREAVSELTITPSATIQSSLPQQPFFFGRKTELSQIYDALKPEKRTWGIIIAGLGGIGKTALAIRAAYQAPEELFDQKIFISAKRKIYTPSGEIKVQDFAKPSFIGMLTELAKQIGVKKVIRFSSSSFVDHLFHSLANKKKLIIFDNLETLTAAERDRLYQFLSNLPKSNKAIVTSRRHLTHPDVGIIPLGYLSHSDSMKLIKEYKKIYHRLQKVKYKDLSKLCRITNGNPYLIDWIVGQLENESSNCYTLDNAYQRLKINMMNGPLDYIFGDLFDKLTDNEKNILDVLCCLKKPTRKISISNKTNMALNETDLILHDLVCRSIIIENDTEETLYKLPELAKEYLKQKINIQRGVK